MPSTAWISNAKVAMRKVIVIDLKDIHFETHSFAGRETLCAFSSDAHWCVQLFYWNAFLLFDAHSDSEHSDAKRADPNVEYCCREYFMHIKFKLMIWWVVETVVLPQCLSAANELHRPWINRVNVIPPGQTLNAAIGVFSGRCRVENQMFYTAIPPVSKRG